MFLGINPAPNRTLSLPTPIKYSDDGYVKPRITSKLQATYSNISLHTFFFLGIHFSTNFVFSPRHYANLAVDEFFWLPLPSRTRPVLRVTKPSSPRPPPTTRNRRDWSRSCCQNRTNKIWTRTKLRDFRILTMKDPAWEGR